MAKGLSQSRLANDAGLTQASVSRIEAGRADPRFSTVGALATALECEVTDLLSTGTGGNEERAKAKLQRSKLSTETYEELYQLYPKKGTKKAGQKLLRQKVRTEAKAAVVREALLQVRKDWQGENLQYMKDWERYVRKELWEERYMPNSKKGFAPRRGNFE